MSRCQGEENLGEIVGQGMKGDTATVTADTEQDHDLQEDTDRINSDTNYVAFCACEIQATKQ